MYFVILPFSQFSYSDTRIGDVGGQKTLRTYWKNYFEKTDTLIWVVDSTDAARLGDCRDELKKLLLEEVRPPRWFNEWAG
jgi:GTPase SAR1 family protein